MKKFQNDNQIYCRHDLPKDTEFLLTHCGQNYKEKHVKKNGKVEYKTIVQKWLESRPCKEDTFNRDELFAILEHLGEYFPGKKADFLFFASNQDNDTTMDVDEFIMMWMSEQ